MVLGIPDHWSRLHGLSGSAGLGSPNVSTFTVHALITCNTVYFVVVVVVGGGGGGGGVGVNGDNDDDDDDDDNILPSFDFGTFALDSKPISVTWIPFEECRFYLL